MLFLLRSVEQWISFVVDCFSQPVWTRQLTWDVCVCASPENFKVCSVIVIAYTSCMLRLKYFKMENLSIWCCISWIKISLTVNRMKVLQLVRFVWHHETLLASPDEERCGSVLVNTPTSNAAKAVTWRERAHYFYTRKLIHTPKLISSLTTDRRLHKFECVFCIRFAKPVFRSFTIFSPMKWMDHRIWNDEENRSVFDWNSQNSTSYLILALSWFRNAMAMEIK